MPNTKISAKKIIIWLIKGVVSVGLIFFLVITVDWDKVSTLNNTSLLAIGIGASVTLLLFTFMALRWSLLVKAQTTTPFTVATAYRGYLIGLFFNICMPGAIGGDLVRTKYCQDRCGITLKTSGLIIVTERLFGLTALSLFFMLGLLNNYKILPGLHLELTWVINILTAFLLIIFIAKYWISKRITLKKRFFVILVLLSLLGQSADIITVGLLTWTFGYAINASQLIFIMPLVYIATAIPISLGGLGVRESVLAGMLSLYGVMTADAIIIAFILFLIKASIGIIFGLPLFFRNRMLFAE